jgi:hypothetical protein
VNNSKFCDFVDLEIKNSIDSSSPVNRPVDPKQIATEIINTPAFSL